MKRLSILLTGAFFICAFNDCYAAPGRQRLLMDPGWKFSLTDTVGADKASFNDSKWKTLDLPHDWSIENAFIENAPTGGSGGYLPTGIGWYRKHFVLSKSAAAKNVWVEFDGVYQNAEVWINGHYLGKRPNGYISFVYDLTPYLRKGENIISVKVDNSLQPNSRWYSGSGIYRHVWLNIADPLHIAQWGTYITSPLADSASSLVSVKTKIENKNMFAVSAVLRSIILDANGNELARKESPFSVLSNNVIESEQQLRVSSPSLWSLETPYLYTIRSFIISKEKIIDSTASSFGIRDIKYDADKGFLLNGKRVKMNGVCLHHDAGSVGAAVPEAIWVRRLQVLKDMGCNAIRTSHNPPAPEFLDLCDRMGFLVMDEAFDVWESGKVKNDYHLYFDEWSQRDLTDQIDRDRNHPSVVMWSAGNEIPDQKSDKGIDLLKVLLATFHKEDPSRPVTTANDDIAADNGATQLAFIEAEDIVGYNYVDRWHERRELFYSIDRHDHPAWKMVGTESVAIAGVRGNYFGGNFFHTDSSIIKPANLPGVVRAEQLWKYVSVHDYVIGDFMWTGIDYLGEARWPFRSSSSGVIDLCGFPKDAYYFYQSQWTQKPMLHLFPHWNWKGKEGTIIQVMAYTNCDSVELFLNGKSFGIKALEFPRQGNSGGWNKYDRPPVGITTGDLHLTWDVPYKPGILKAVGRKAGKIACEEEMRTTGAPAAIRLSVDHSIINAGTRDVAQIKIEVVDENGYKVPDADNQIQISVEGAGSLIGFDNGNPADHASMKDSRRKVFNGLALAVIQSNGNAGGIHVRAGSPEIRGASAEISVQEINAQVATVEPLKK
jgi:beta-galactosidase